MLTDEENEEHETVHSARPSQRSPSLPALDCEEDEVAHKTVKHPKKALKAKVIQP